MKLNLVVIAVATAVILSPTTSIAQTRRNRTPPRPQQQQPTTTQTAVTRDGRTVILRSDGTWEYTNDPPPPSPSTSNAPAATRQNSTLSLQAGLVFRSGDVKPIARTTFYLLDDDLAKILREAGVQPPARSSSSGDDPDRQLVFSFGLLSRYATSAEEQQFSRAAMDALRPHILQTVTTDFNGSVTFAPVAAGTYYVMGLAQTPRGFAIWNLRVELQGGQSSVTLDQNNAVYAG